MSKKLLNLCLASLLSVVCTAAWALSDVGGVYQIGSAADLEEFAALVNDGEVNANAVLTADITDAYNGTMIGTETNRYQGTFEGAGHTIKINLQPEEANAGLFRYTGVYAIIQNLKVQGTITTQFKFAGGIVARNRGIIRGCYADVTIASGVAGDATHGGIAAVSNKGTLIENCLAKIAIIGATTTNCGGVVGWAEERTNIVNCLVVSDESTFAFTDTSNGHSNNLGRNEGNVKAIDLETYNQDSYANRPGGACYNNYVTVDWGSNVATTVVPYDELADGRICYQLNNDQSRIGWAQKIGTDPFPVPAAFSTSRVYASGATDCDGLAEGLTFSNSGTAQATAHQFDKYGVCTTCGCFNFHYFEDANKYDQAGKAVLFETKADIDAAEGWNRVVNGFPLNMKLAGDINYTADPGQYIFNNSDMIRGNFDGQGHSITYQMSGLEARAALFPIMYGNVENLVLHGSIDGVSGQNAGSVAGEARMALVRNVFSDVNINSDLDGDNSSGGFFGWMGEVERRVENCIYAGDFTTPRNPSTNAGCVRIGGFAGWAATQTYFTNCAFLGNLIGAGCPDNGQGNIENSMNISRNPDNAICENVYVANPIESYYVTTQYNEPSKFTVYDNAEGIANGELAFFLNGKQNGLERFYQLIGTDPEPMPIAKEGALVYCVSANYRCDGTPIGSDVAYSNNASGTGSIPPHNFVDGYCTVCGQFQSDYLTPVDGFFEISTGFDLKWWSIYASQHPDACAKLTDDIDMNGFMDGYIPVATFTGTFDGQGHTISNFVLEGANNLGLIGVIGNGAVIKNVVLDNTCSITGSNYCGVVGATSGSGQIYIENVGMEGNVIVTGINAAGIIGVDSGGSMDMFITNCWVTGEIDGNQDPNVRGQCGAICGYSSGGSIVKNCWSTAHIPEGAIYSSDSFTRGGAQVVNCYEADIEGVAQNKQQHYNPTAANRLTITLPLEDVASGALCYNLNGKQFTEPTWFQTLDEDEHPYPFDTHGVVVSGGGKFFSIPNSSISDVTSEIESAELEAIDGVIATQSLIDEWSAAVSNLSDVETFEDLTEVLTAVEAAKAAVTANAAVYKAYIDKCEEVKAYLEAHTDFEGSLRTALEKYLSDVEEPDTENPLGTYEYIVDVHTATAEEIAAETERVAKWLQDAISQDYMPGTDVSTLIENSDFSQQNDGWTGGFGNSFGQVKDDAEQTVNGVEAWNVTGDMYQTVEGLKPGYYLLGTHAAFRPSNNRYSTNYAAGFYANGIFNYFPAVIEDPVSFEDAVDGVNCNLTIGGAKDLPIYDDGRTTEGEDGIVGYVIQGETGMAIAAMADRYKAYTIAKVGEDGKLTVGIKNPGTNYGSDWTGWGALNLVYCGNDEAKVNDALDTVIENMVARATTIIDYEADDYEADPSLGPNFPQALRDELQGLVDQVEDIEGVEAKTALVKAFSDKFQTIYEGKQAYVSLFDYASTLDMFEAYNLDLVEKDEEGEWYDTGELLFSEDETEAIFDATEPMYAAFFAGSYSTEEALNPMSLAEGDAAAAVAAIMPEQDADGYYLIGTPKQFGAFRVIASEKNRYAKGKLIADVDMAGVAMLPIGHNRGENAQHIFMGEFDGQGHALTNVYIENARIPSGEYDEPATLFYELQNATVKNLKLTGEYFNSTKFTGGVTRYTTGKTTIDNCEIGVTIHLDAALAEDASSGGVVGYNASANTLISNCLVKCKLVGPEDAPIWYCGGLVGWSAAAFPVTNTLVINEYEYVGVEGDNSQTIARGNGANLTNVFVKEYFRGAQGTLVTDEQLASGEICWKLNGNKSDDAHWFQTLGTDATPYLFGSDVVYLYGGAYTNDKPNPQLNAFAYALEATVAGSNVIVSFLLNAEAESAEVRFSNGYTQAADGELAAGIHRIIVPTTKLGSDPTALSYEIAVQGKGSKDVLKVGESYKVWGPYGMAINNNPASKNFGQILLAESWIDVYNNNGFVGYHSADKVGALYAFDANFKPVNAADGTPGFYGGLDIQNETPLAIRDGYNLDLMDLRFTEDGRLFVARASGTSNSSVWEINPEDLDKPWKPVFTGGELDEATGITYVGGVEQNRMAIGMAFAGKGDDLKMYVLGGQRSNGQLNATDYNCSIYNLGTATEWTGAPSANFEPLDGVYTNTSYCAGIHEDGQGGLWYIQSVSGASAEKPAIKHYNAEGEEDYSDVVTNTGSGRMAVSSDGTYLAIPMGSGKIVLYEVNYVPMEGGRLFLNPSYIINVSETSIASLAFDYADNLYVSSGGTETFSRYTIPQLTRLVVTPGNGIGTGIFGDVNNDGKVDGIDAQAILNVMSDNGYKMECDVDKDGKVDGIDYQTVLNIMSDM